MIKLKKIACFLFASSLSAGAVAPLYANDKVDLSFSGKPIYIESTEIEEFRKKDNWSGRLGVGLSYAPEFLGADAYSSYTAFDFKASWRDRIFIENNKFGSVLVKSRLVRAGVISRVNSGRNEDLSGTELAGFPKLDKAFEVGAFAGTSLYKLFLTGEMYLDVSNVHRGAAVELETGYTLELNSRLSLTPIIGAAWGSMNYVKTYFGAPDELASQFDGFDAKSGFFEYFGEAALEYRLSKSWLLKGGVRYAQLIGAAAKSPVVKSLEGSDNQTSGFMAIVWLF